MSVLDEVLRANADFARTYDSRRATTPVRYKLAFVTCMDYRLSLEAFGLKTGDAYVLRNAGGIVTEDVLRSLLVAYSRLGVEEVLVVNHTECGMRTFRDEDLRAEMRQRTGTDAVAPEQFHAFQDLEDNVRQQIQRLRSHPWFPAHVPVNGCIYDVRSGRLTPVPLDGAPGAGGLPPLSALPPLSSPPPHTR